jgi:hypothetical protein
MPGSIERRQGKRIRTRMTAVVRARRRPVVLRVLNLAAGGAFCRCRVPFRLGATFPVEFLVDGLGPRHRPRTFRAYCRVVRTAVRLGPTRPLQEIGLSFLDLAPSDRDRLVALLSAAAAA